MTWSVKYQTIIQFDLATHLYLMTCNLEIIMICFSGLYAGPIVRRLIILKILIGSSEPSPEHVMLNGRVSKSHFVILAHVVVPIQAHFVSPSGNPKLVLPPIRNSTH